MSSRTVSASSARNTARLSEAARELLGLRVRTLASPRFTRRSLAVEARLGLGTVMDLWAGRSDPTLSTLLAIAEALDLASLEELLAPLGTQVFRSHQREEAKVAAGAA